LKASVAIAWASGMVISGEKLGNNTVYCGWFTLNMIPYVKSGLTEALCLATTAAGLIPEPWEAKSGKTEVCALYKTTATWLGNQYGSLKCLSSLSQCQGRSLEMWVLSNPMIGLSRVRSQRAGVRTQVHISQAQAKQLLPGWNYLMQFQWKSFLVGQVDGSQTRTWKMKVLRSQRRCTWKNESQ